MDIKVNTEYCDKIVSECDLALEAVGNLNYAVMGLSRTSRGKAQYRQRQDEVFQAIGCILTSAGNLSCLIWPNKDRKRREKLGHVNIMNAADHMETAEHFRRRLRLDRRHILHQRWLKDCFAEKISSEQLHNQETTFYVVGSYLPFSGHFMPTMACWYDPISRRFQCGGETLDIQELAAAVYRMKISLQDEFLKIGQESPSEIAMVKMSTAACA